MGRVRIYRKSLTDVEVENLKELAIGAGFLPEDLELFTDIGEHEASEDEVVLVFMTPDQCSEPTLESTLAQVPARGRAICIWPAGAPEAELPAGVKKYSYSIIAWNPERLRACSADDDVAFFENSSGVALPPIDTERNICVLQ